MNIQYNLNLSECQLICRAGINTVHINMIQYVDIYNTESELLINCFLSMFFKFSIKNQLHGLIFIEAGRDKKNEIN